MKRPKAQLGEHGQTGQLTAKTKHWKLVILIVAVVAIIFGVVAILPGGYTKRFLLIGWGGCAGLLVGLGLHPSFLRTGPH